MDPLNPLDKLFYSPADLAQVLGIGRSTLFGYLRQGQLPKPQYLNARVARWPYTKLAKIFTNGPAAIGTYAAPPPPAEPDITPIEEWEAKQAAAAPKKRGRSAKLPTAAELAEKQIVIEGFEPIEEFMAKDAAAAASQKKRGRPRKDPPPEPAPKRPRGRPRKTPPTSS